MTLAAPLDLLRQARARFTQREIAAHVGKDIKTVRRWEKGETPCPAMLEPALRDLLHKARPAQARRGGGEPSSASSICSPASAVSAWVSRRTAANACSQASGTSSPRKTYRENYPAGGEHALIGDIVSFPAEDVPSHDVLLGGFPCQPFSIAGVSKKNALGRPHGFECTTQGTLFFDVARIIAAKRPAAFLLENVKNLLSHDKGRTFDVILQTLRDELGYEVHYRVVDGQHFTPQHRERIIIVGFRGKTSFSWDDLRLPESGPRLGSILHRTDGSEPVLPWDHDRFFDHAANAYSRSTRSRPICGPICKTTRRNIAQRGTASASAWLIRTASRARCPRVITRTARRFWSIRASSRGRAASRRANAPG